MSNSQPAEQFEISWNEPACNQAEIPTDIVGAAMPALDNEFSRGHLPSEPEFPDWMVQAASSLLTALQHKEEEATLLALKIQDNLSARRAGIVAQSQDMDQLVSGPLLDALSFGSHILSGTLGDTVSAMADSDTARQFRTYLVFSVVRVVMWSESEQLLSAWWQSRGEAPLFSDSEEKHHYPVLTSQEVDALLSSICHAPGGLYWKNNLQAGTRTYERKDMAHSVRLELSPDERDAGLTTDALEQLTLTQDADAMFAVLYVSRVLAPPTPLPANLRAGAWIDADDVIEKIGWKPRSTSERQAMRRRVWNYLRYGARACVTGHRTSVYVDRQTGKTIDTYIDGPAWAFVKEEKPMQPSLFGDEEVPLRVELVVSQEWTRLTTSPLLSQYLPMGELLGQITPDQPSGAWARVLGLSLSSFWRRNPRQTINGELRPTRREILDHYPPKVAPPQEILSGKNPRRALDYWHGALQILVSNGFLEPSGEAVIGSQKAGEELPRKNWKEGWLDGEVDLRPGPIMKDAVASCAHALPSSQPKRLNAKKRSRLSKT